MINNLLNNLVQIHFLMEINLDLEQDQITKVIIQALDLIHQKYDEIIELNSLKKSGGNDQDQNLKL
jgi:hypothetical protein